MVVSSVVSPVGSTVVVEVGSGVVVVPSDVSGFEPAVVGSSIVPVLASVVEAGVAFEVPSVWPSVVSPLSALQATARVQAKG